jgi:hypothetical protein
MSNRFQHIPPQDIPGNNGQFLYLLDQETGQYFYLKPGSGSRWKTMTPALKPEDDEIAADSADAGRPFPWLLDPKSDK